MALESRGQVAQMLAQIDVTLETVRTDRTWLLQALVSIADETDGAILHELRGACPRGVVSRTVHSKSGSRVS